MNSQNLKTRWIKVTLIVLFSVAMLCVVGYQLFKYQCLWWNCAPKRDFTLWDLGIPPAFFPPHTLFVMRPAEGDILAEELIGGIPGIASYGLGKYATKNQASNRFDIGARSNLFTDPPKNIEELSDILNYQSLIADDFLVECGYAINDFRCVIRARYQEFYIEFRGSLDEDKMTKENFLGVMMFIDSLMAELLGDKLVCTRSIEISICTLPITFEFTYLAPPKQPAGWSTTTITMTPCEGEAFAFGERVDGEMGMGE